MTKSIRNSAILALAISLAGAMSFAQSGEATYKSKCQVCHGPSGTPSAGMQKMLGVKPASEYKALTVAQIQTTVKNGSANKKMHPISGLSDAQVKAVAEYFKTLK